MRPYGLFALLVLPQAGWAVDISVSAGSESFLWEEYDSGGGKLLDESGLRHFIAVEAKGWIDGHWQSDFGGRVYSGTVEYDGQTQTGAPVTTDTDYDGMQLEAGFSYFPGSASSGQGRTGIRMAVGVDTWRRNLLGNGGYREDYTTTYGRIGAHYGDGGFWAFNLGAKYPFATTEGVGLKDLGFDSDVTLHPQGRFSLYADLAMQFSPQWGMRLYYDSYRFAESDPEPVYSPVDSATYSVWQPESRMDVLGAQLSFNF
jgi:hypothetical protein